MADVKPFLLVFVSYFDRCYYQSDCGRSIATFCWQMLLPLLCDRIMTHIILKMWFDVTRMADVIAIFYCGGC